jgi:hypothetical protein
MSPLTELGHRVSLSSITKEIFSPSAGLGKYPSFLNREDSKELGIISEKIGGKFFILWHQPRDQIEYVESLDALGDVTIQSRITWRAAMCSQNVAIPGIISYGVGTTHPDDISARFLSRHGLPRSGKYKVGVICSISTPK